MFDDTLDADCLTNNPVNILIVDDKPDNLLAIEALLQDKGYNLVKAGSGEEALRHLLGMEFALILMDVYMPELDGIETASFIRMREQSKHTPIIFITAASSSDKDIERAYAVGAVDFLLKPIVPAFLQTKVSVFVELHLKKMHETKAKQHLADLTKELIKSNDDLEQLRKSLERLVQDRTVKLNESLREAEEARDWITGILKSITDGLVVTDIHDRVVLMNRTAENILGVRFSEIKGRSIDFAIKNKTLHEMLRKIMESKQAGDHFDFVAMGSDANQHSILQARTSIIHNREGLATGIIAIMCDVSHEREVDRMKTNFITTAAHELKTPLTSIRGFSEILMLRKDLTSEEKSKFLRYINEQSESLSTVLNDLLDIAQIEAGVGFFLEKTNFDIGDMARGVIQYYQEQHEKHIFQSILPENPLIVFADKEKLSQVLINFLSNALKYSSNGGNVRILVEFKDMYYQISIADEGIGMTPEQVDKMFNKFYRVDASNTALQGSGLGAGIARHIVEAHKGKVQVESELGRGTTVMIRLPVLNA